MLAYMSHTEHNVRFWMFMQCERPAYNNHYALEEVYANYLPENPVMTWLSGMWCYVGGRVADIHQHFWETWGYTLNSSMRIANESSTARDNIFVDKSRNCTIHPVINGLSDYDAQLIGLNNVVIPNQASKTYLIRNINRFTIADFQI